jgi:hypothetical protein
LGIGLIMVLGFIELMGFGLIIVFGFIELIGAGLIIEAGLAMELCANAAGATASMPMMARQSARVDFIDR